MTFWEVSRLNRNWMEGVRSLLARQGHIAVPLPGLAAARADEVRAAVPALLGDPGHIRSLADLADGWAADPDERAAITWARRSPSDPRGGKCHLQSVAGFDRFVIGRSDAPELLRAVLRRLDAFGVAAERLLGGLVDGLRCTVRANVYEPGGGVPVHVDESALTVVFTPVPEALLAAAPGRRAPLRPVAGGGWHAVVLPGAQVGAVLPGLVPTAHAAAPVDDRRLSVTVFAHVDDATLRESTSSTTRPARTVAA
jgi:hypothetical protein